MQVTVDLGYEYVWIDSLCIIQDSPGWADWVRECPRVGHIYANGDCNLSATGFPTGLGGMVAKRNAAVLAPCLVTIPGAGPVYVFEEGDPDEESTYPIISRGWVVQEHALICWVCRASVVSEIDFGITSGVVPVLQKNQKEKKLFAAVLNGLGDSDRTRGQEEDPQHIMLMEWYDWAQRVSGTRLTRYSDRLPALSGLAAYLHPSMQSSYVAGHWEGELLMSLLWRPAEAVAHDGFIAPSWSWISSLRPLTFRFPALGVAVALSRNVGFDVTLSAEADPFGAVTDGALYLCGPVLKPVKMSLTEDDKTEYFVKLPGDWWIHIAMHPDNPGTWTLPCPIMNQKEPARPEAAEEALTPASPSCWWPDSLHLLPLYSEPPFGISGLLLEKVGDGRSGGGAGDGDSVFRRVGTFQKIRFMHHHKAMAATGRPDADPGADAISSLPGWDFTVI
ncbi:heterokaryon incompatibility protein [Colletotrichum tofieldiae]|nr:heterokaryon incompatibility protein [Colletotrichum tofieldiae]GKT69228.1 heterokaryon incompatibility protein [Colletotrichum tofieldiae]